MTRTITLAEKLATTVAADKLARQETNRERQLERVKLNFSMLLLAYEAEEPGFIDDIIRCVSGQNLFRRIKRLASANTKTGS